MARLRSRTGTYDQGIIASSSAPSAAFVGQIWFNNATGVTYQWTTDGASNFWLDISSGGIGASASRGVDYVGDTDPLITHNGGSATLSVGQVYYNREANRHFVCTDATGGANVWQGRYAGWGGLETSYLSGGYYYRVHTFLSTGTIFIDGTTVCDVLAVGGGGGGGRDGGGGGGAGGLKTAAALSVTAGTYTVTVGAGAPNHSNASTNASSGTSSIFSTVTAYGGGGGAGTNNTATAGTYGSGGGGHRGSTGHTGAAGTAGQGNSGGNGHSSPGRGGGGGGAGEAGNTDGHSEGGDGATNDYRTGSNITYAGGGGGAGNAGEGAAGGGTGGGGAGNHSANGVDGTDGLGGGGGADGASGGSLGGAGGSGIVVIRYKLNP